MKKNSVGTLCLVATPIGNLSDMSSRAIEALKNADVIYCEDTRRTLRLLHHFEVFPKKSLQSFHEHSSPKTLISFSQALSEGKFVVYVTDAGMPAISDPGFLLVRQAKAQGAKVTAVPGPVAFTMLFAVSALGSPKMFFHGFFPRVQGEIEKVLEQIKTIKAVHLFYEAPGRLLNSVEILSKNLKTYPTVVGRELTKIHEELVSGSAEEVFQELSAREAIRGECVVAVLGGEPESKTVDRQNLTDEQKAEIRAMVHSGLSSKDIAKELSKKFGVSRRLIYEFIIRTS